LTTCSALKISSGGTTAALAPSLGGAVLSVVDARGPLLRMGTAPAVAADPRAAACFPCAPWFGRLSLDFAALGRASRLKASLPDATPLALHGDGWISSWDVLTHTEDQLTCRLWGAPSPSGFPFAYELEQDFRVDKAGFRVTLTLNNRDTVRMPAGLGLHPYFRRTSSTRIRFSASGLWTPPVARAPGRHGGLPSPLGEGVFASLPDETLDHSFTGFGGAAVIADGPAAVRLITQAPTLHLYAPRGETFFCLEPITHLPGAFLEDGDGRGGARLLAPGDTMSLGLVIDRPP
jgi:aldose 1-epimerase